MTDAVPPTGFALSYGCRITHGSAANVKCPFGTKVPSEAALVWINELIRGDRAGG
jgi:hypothetical protein